MQQLSRACLFPANQNSSNPSIGDYYACKAKNKTNGHQKNHQHIP
jgi:hypothetical protein